MEFKIKSLWENSCLICLQESNNDMISINKTSDNESVSLLEKLVKCTDFNIAQLEKNTYPEKICKKCYSNLLVTFKFITLSENSKVKLERLHIKLRELTNEELSINTTGVCKKCSETEDTIKYDLDVDTGNIIFYEEEHITSEFENDEDMVGSTIKKHEKKKTKNNTNIFEESKKKALERSSKEKFQKCICDLCGNYYSQNQLKYHRMRHDKEKRFECEICHRKFATETDLRRHMRVHTGEKPYACQYCDRKFSDYGSRIKHERCHTGERPYTCKTCNKSFMYSHALKKHQSVHTGYKAFACEICQKGFTKREYLENHMKKHNTEENQISENIIYHDETIIEMPSAKIFYLDFGKNEEDLEPTKKIKSKNEYLTK